MIRKMLLCGSLLCTLPPPAWAEPPPGHPTPEEASRTLGIPRQPGPLTRQGRVLESFDSNSYTYILVGSPEGRLWLAAPRVDPMPVGTPIRFSSGTLMKNFFSRKHQRTFEEILFVERVELEKP